ncbi:hypothetical protein C2S52_016210 [Perilla frutescens var. hirtella]|nr:hypothetical protein C2S52_016210 [Perilla frutescens var. hirtella]
MTEIKIPNLRLLAAVDPRGVKSIIFHSRHKRENNIDPDDGNSWLCNACKLPIFSTPFIALHRSGGGGESLYHHDQCNNLPKALEGSDLHSSMMPLALHRSIHGARCTNCDALCGSVLYSCIDPRCDFRLDVKCARVIRIVHRSHDHGLTAIRMAPDAVFACGACGTRHQPGLSWAGLMSVVYVCSTCCFWLHPHCATLPNAIILKHLHQHPLLLNYGSRSSCSCAICGDVVRSWGVYSCAKCGYYVHIMCAMADNQKFDPVLIRDARVPDMVHLPVPDEYTSVVRCITDSTANGASRSDGLLHQHPLTLTHDDPNDDDSDNDEDVEGDHPRPRCNACTQFISPPFYTCSECPGLFLHDCCAHLPRKLTQNPTSIPLVLIGPNKPFIPVAKADCCHRLTNGFTYSFRIPNSNAKFSMDVMCALMPTSITHDAHAKAHILYSSFVTKTRTDESCHCCGAFLTGVVYKCGTCSNFNIHATCARLPKTVRHTFDEHPLKLTTTSSHRRSESSNLQLLICEICERGMDHKQWHYRCDECDQSFHVDCIPCLDRKSSIKYEAAKVRLQCHECSLALVRGHMVRGRHCGYCGESYKDSDHLALACSNCYFGIHARCATKIVGVEQNRDHIILHL